MSKGEDLTIRSSPGIGKPAGCFAKIRLLFSVMMEIGLYLVANRSQSRLLELLLVRSFCEGKLVRSDNLCDRRLRAG